MAGEAILLYETELPIPFVCANTTGIEKGALLELADFMVVTTSNGDADICAGIATEEKITLDGKTTIPVYMGGIFDMLCSGTITVGQAIQSGVATGGANAVMVAAAGSVGMKVIGFALETGTNGERIRCLIRIGCNGMAVS